MTDREKLEDQKISECLQEAFGYTDEQLLKKLEQANEDLKDVTFPGAEDRMMQRFMARKAEMEKDESASVQETETAGEPAENTNIEESLGNVASSKPKPDQKKEKKIVRFGKKKLLATAALVAVITGMLGGTAVGKRSLFFRQSGKPAEILLDNAGNKTDNSALEKMYDEIKNRLDMPVLKLEYLPDGMKVKDYEIYSNGAKIRFSYQDRLIYITQLKKERSTSQSIKSDREEERQVFNKWLNLDIGYGVNMLEDHTEECEAVIIRNDCFYYIEGDMQEKEFKKILEYLNFL